MAKLMGKHWYDRLEWSQGPKRDSLVLFGHSFPKVDAIHVYRSIEHDEPVFRWRNKGDDVIHEFVPEPDWKYDDPTTQIQALLVAIKLS